MNGDDEHGIPDKAVHRVALRIELKDLTTGERRSVARNFIHDARLWDMPRTPVELRTFSADELDELFRRSNYRREELTHWCIMLVREMADALDNAEGLGIEGIKEWANWRRIEEILSVTPASPHDS